MQIQRFSLYKQIELFQGTQEMIKAKIGPTEAGKFFQEARYVVALGSNDFINNYLMPVYSDSWTYNDATFIDYLMETLNRQLQVILIKCVIKFTHVTFISRMRLNICCCVDIAWVRGKEADGVWIRTHGLYSTTKGSKYHW